MSRDDDFAAFASNRWLSLARSAVLLGASHHEAEDLAQTVLMRCYVSWRKVEAATYPDAYVARILVNEFTRSRRRKWWQERPTADLPECSTPDNADHADHVDGADGCTPGESKSSGALSAQRGPNYPTNSNGLTYGAEGRDGAHLPDLVAVLGDCGMRGYVHASDLEDAPWEPGAGDGEPRTVAVFDSDGVTQVDTFTLERGRSSTGDDSHTKPDDREPTAGVDGADLQGVWIATIGGITNPDGSQEFDTYRDVDMRITLNRDRLWLWDGCQAWEATFNLADGSFVLDTPVVKIESKTVGCGRAAPLPDIVENVRHVSRKGDRVYMHLANWQIVLVLTTPEQ